MDFLNNSPKIQIYIKFYLTPLKGIAEASRSMECSESLSYIYVSIFILVIMGGFSTSTSFKKEEEEEEATPDDSCDEHKNDVLSILWK